MTSRPIFTAIQPVFVMALLLSISACRKEKTNTIIPASNYSDYSFEEPSPIGNNFYIDPLNGSMDGDGSASKPWSTLQEVIDSDLIQYYRNSDESTSGLDTVHPGAPVKGGDKLILRSGYHGYVSITTFIFTEWLTIEAEQNHTPVLSHFRMNGAFKNVYLKNLTILKESFEGEGNYWEDEAINRNTSACIYLGSNDFWGKGSHVKLKGLSIKTAENTGSWTAADWVEKSAGGISLRSVENVEIIGCTIENIRHGIAIEYHSDHSIAIDNKIKNYSGDGCRLISNDVLFAYNTITDCYDVDENHDDAIQSYSRGDDNSAGTGTLYNNIVRGNLIIGTTEYDNPLAGSPQGIGCFDGMFDGWTVENNVIITDHYHGISFYGMRNSHIVNNTVIDQKDGNDISPWIRITDHKNGTPSANVTVANNIAASSISVSGSNVVENNNYVIGKSEFAQIYQLFVDPDALDLHLKSNELTLDTIIDAGEIFPNLISSDIDRDHMQRDGLPDLGAYEYHPN